MSTANPISIAERQHGRVRWLDWLLSTRRLMVFVILSLVFMFAARPIIDPDFWWHLKTGEYIFVTHTIPRVDLFSTIYQGREWVTHEWLSEYLIFGIYQLSGIGGLIVLFALVVTATFWIVTTQISRRVKHPLILGSCVLLGALASAPTWGVRPQMFSFLLASVYLAILQLHVRRPESKRVFLLVPLMTLWANLHAGFAIGLAFILLVGCGVGLEQLLKHGRAASFRRLKVLGLIFILCLFAVLINPSGARLYSYPIETLRSPAMMKYISEWRSPDFHAAMFQPLAFLILALLCSVGLSKRPVRLRSFLLLLVTGWMTLKSARNVPFFSLVATPILAEHCYFTLKSTRLSHWLSAPETRETGTGVVVKILLNVLLLLAVPVALSIQRVNSSIRSQPEITRQTFPVNAVEVMRSNELPQPILNDYGWGGYLIWELYPTYRVHIDGRADVYGDAFLEEFLKTEAGEGDWKEPLDKYNIKTVIIRVNSPMANLLRNQSNWKQIFADTQAAIFIRQ